MIGKTAEQIRRLEDWFGKKLKGDQFVQLVSRIKHIPSNALSEIVDNYINDIPPTPGRFPTISKLLDGWYAWKKDHPERMIGFKRQPCSACRSVGYIWARKLIDGVEYEQVFRCHGCENWKADCNEQSNIPIFNRDRLLAMGYEIVDLVAPPGLWPPPKGGVNSVAKKTLGYVPDGNDHKNMVKRQAREIFSKQRHDVFKTNGG